MFSFIELYYKSLIPALTADDYSALEKLLTIQYISKDKFLVRENEICRNVSFINKGLVRLYYVADGKEICVGFEKDFGYVSEYTSFLTQQPSALNIKALEDCAILNLSFNDLQLLYKSHPVFEQFGRKIAEHLFIALSTYNIRLLSLSPEEHYQWIIKNQPYIIQRVPQYMTASYIGVSPEHLSRIRKSFQEKIS